MALNVVGIKRHLKLKAESVLFVAEIIQAVPTVRGSV
jgi:hypothetical protein